VLKAYLEGIKAQDLLHILVKQKKTYFHLMGIHSLNMMYLVKDELNECTINLLALSQVYFPAAFTLRHFDKRQSLKASSIINYEVFRV